MLQIDGTLMTPVLGLFLLLPACGDDGGGGGGGGTDGGGGTGGASDDGADDESGENQPPPPDPNGDQCGGDVVGWDTECLVQSSDAVASDRGAIPGIPPSGASTSRALCCEGNPSIAEADEGCQGYCMLEVCEAALIDHLSRCESCSWFDCGFDLTDCLAGGEHKQTVACLIPLTLTSYTLTTSCSALNNETRNPDGSFHFLEQPANDPMTDPKICQPTDDLQLDPPRGLGHFKGSGRDGTVAHVTWSMAGASGEERSEDLDAHFEYGLVPCAASSNECLALAALELTLPPTVVLGMTITKANLSVVSIDEAPPVERGEHFRFSEGSIGVLMQAYVDGVPLLLTGTNVGTTSGRISPTGDQFSLSGLRFEYTDSVVTAALDLEIQGQYDARRPTAQITRLHAPERCDEPLSLLATSWDGDQDLLTHEWWIQGAGSFSGPLVEVVLPAGEHEVMLTSRDPTGLVDTETLRYARVCR